MKRPYISLKEFKKDPTQFTNWQIIDLCRDQKMSEKFMWEMRDYLIWSQVCYNTKIKFTPSFLTKVRKYVDWDVMTWKYGDTWDEDFIRENKDFIDWDNLCRRKILREEFIYEMYDYINFDSLFQHNMKGYSESFLRSVLLDHPRLINNITRINQYTFSLDFIREIRKEFDPNTLSNSIDHPNNWKIVNEFKFNLNPHAWFQILKNDDPDLKLLLRFKENVYWDNTYFIEWYLQRNENCIKEEKDIQELRNYLEWIRIKNGYSKKEM